MYGCDCCGKTLRHPCTMVFEAGLLIALLCHSCNFAYQESADEARAKWLNKHLNKAEATKAEALGGKEGA